MQLKFEHKYFKSYFIKLSNYETKKCDKNCNFTQISKCLLLRYRHFINKQSIIINEMKSQIIKLKIFFETKKDLENLRKFLINIEIVTKKWNLKNTGKDEKNEQIISI